MANTILLVEQHYLSIQDKLKKVRELLKRKGDKKVDWGMDIDGPETVRIGRFHGHRGEENWNKNKK